MPNYKDKENKSVIRKGSGISVYLGKDTSESLIKWLNSLNDIGPTVRNILEQYVAGELIYIPSLKKAIIDKNEENIFSNSANQATYDNQKKIKLNDNHKEPMQKESDEQFKDTSKITSNETSQDEMEEDPDDVVIEDYNPFVKPDKREKKREKPDIVTSWDSNK